MYSSLALLEFSHIVRSLGNPIERRRLPAEVVQQYDLDHWGSDALVRHRWMTDAITKLGALLDEFAIVYEVPMLPEYGNDVTRMMIRHDLRSFDALHLVTAQHHGIDHFATADRHFLGIDGMTVHIVRDS